MPCGGPNLPKTDIETIRRWIVGSNPYTNGDPHIRTNDGVRYDFQAAGEYVLLRGENLEVQARHTPVETNAPLGPNGHTGLTTCVSLNTAIAVKIGNTRISYQPNISGKPDPSGLQLRINGELARVTSKGISLGVNGRIMPTTAPGGIQVEAPGGTMIIITPGWWDHYKVWYLNIDTRQVRATYGLMGTVAPGSWLPYLPNGTTMGPMPRDLEQRYNDLYFKFGNAWRVTDSTSLFDYAPGTSTKTFTLEGWPGNGPNQTCKVAGVPGDVKPKPPLTKQAAEALAAGITDPDRRDDCIKDLMLTGDEVFAKTYLLADRINRNKFPEPPKLLFPKDFDTVNANVDFEWASTTDPDGNKLDYKLYVWPENEIPDFNKATDLASGNNWWSGRLQYVWIIALIGLLLLLLIWISGLKKKSGAVGIVIILMLIAMALAYFFIGQKKSGGLTTNFADLDPGKTYFWKVLVEDGEGGVTESETRTIRIQ